LAHISSKSFSGWGFAADPTGGAKGAHPDILAVFKGPTSKATTGGKGEERKGKGGRAPIKMMPSQTKIVNTIPFKFR